MLAPRSCGSAKELPNAAGVARSFVDEHRVVLEQSNGIEAFAGYIRLFGVQTTGSIDAVVWNHPWKFAWGDRCSGYSCFAETAWGDQYTYSLDHSTVD
jgi:hypothetical protein